jgi:hypothetical protein
MWYWILGGLALMIVLALIYVIYHIGYSMVNDVDPNHNSYQPD